MRKVFITGGAGFIGKQLARRLEKNSDIKLYILTRQTLEDRGNIRYIKGDIANVTKITEIIKDLSPTDLIHLAWDVKSEKYAASPQNYDWILYSKQLLKAFLERGGKTVIAAGTCFEYDLSKNLPLNENFRGEPNTPYGKAKLKTKCIFEDLCEEYNVRLVWGRIFYAYGKGEEKRKLLSSIAESLKNDQPFELKTPENVVDYINISDIAKIFEAFLFNPNAKGIINVGTGKGHKIREIAKKIARILGKDESLLKFSTHKPVKIVADTKKLSSVFDCESFVEIDDGLKYLLCSAPIQK